MQLSSSALATETATSVCHEIGSTAQRKPAGMCVKNNNMLAGPSPPTRRLKPPSASNSNSSKPPTANETKMLRTLFMHMTRPNAKAQARRGTEQGKTGGLNPASPEAAGSAPYRYPAA